MNPSHSRSLALSCLIVGLIVTGDRGRVAAHEHTLAAQQRRLLAQESRLLVSTKDATVDQGDAANMSSDHPIGG